MVRSVDRKETLAQAGDRVEMFGILQDGANNGAWIYFYLYGNGFMQALIDLSHLRVVLGPVSEAIGYINDYTCAALYACYNQLNKRVWYPLDRHKPRNAPILNDTATFYDYALLNGRRITPLSRSLRNSAGSCVVQFKWQGETHAGEVLNIFQHMQRDIPNTPIFAEIRWMKRLHVSPLTSSKDNNPWNSL